MKFEELLTKNKIEKVEKTEFNSESAEKSIKFAGEGLKTENYDAIYNFVEGWLAYIRNMDSYNQELKIFSLLSNKEVSTKEINKLIKFE